MRGRPPGAGQAWGQPLGTLAVGRPLGRAGARFTLTRPPRASDRTHPVQTRLWREGRWQERTRGQASLGERQAVADHLRSRSPCASPAESPPHPSSPPWPPSLWEAPSLGSRDCLAAADGEGSEEGPVLGPDSPDSAPIPAPAPGKGRRLGLGFPCGPHPVLAPGPMWGQAPGLRP